MRVRLLTALIGDVDPGILDCFMVLGLFMSSFGLLGSLLLWNAWLLLCIPAGCVSMLYAVGVRIRLVIGRRT